MLSRMVLARSTSCLARCRLVTLSPNRPSADLGSLAVLRRRTTEDALGMAGSAVKAPPVVALLAELTVPSVARGQPVPP